MWCLLLASAVGLIVFDDNPAYQLLLSTAASMYPQSTHYSNIDRYCKSCNQKKIVTNRFDILVSITHNIVLVIVNTQNFVLHSSL